MPCGHNLQTCLCCGKVEIVGDCILTVCHDCSAAGHTGAGCRKCDDEIRNSIARKVAQALHRRCVLREAPPAPSEADEFSAGIL